MSALAARPRDWRYGYDLCRETGLRSGTLYPLLMRLAEQGLLESEWRPPQVAGRPARHAYRLTGPGVRSAAETEPGETGAPLTPAGARA